MITVIQRTVFPLISNLRERLASEKLFSFKHVSTAHHGELLRIFLTSKRIVRERPFAFSHLLSLSESVTNCCQHRFVFLETIPVFRQKTPFFGEVAKLLFYIIIDAFYQHLYQVSRFRGTLIRRDKHDLIPFSLWWVIT